MSETLIVAATDGSEESLRAVGWAAGEAVLRGAPLRIVSATELLPQMIGGHAMSDDTVDGGVRHHRDQALAAAAARAAQTAPDVLIDTDPLEGTPAHVVSTAGSGAAMLVVGSRGLGAFAAMLLGSVSRYAATHAACPVVVVREVAGPEHRQVGVGVGDVHDCDAVLGYAFEEAALRNAGVLALHAWHMPQFDISRAGQMETGSDAAVFQHEAVRQLARPLKRWREKYPSVPVSHDVVQGHPGRALIDLSARADLVVLGRRTPHHGPGTVIHAVLNHAHGPVMTVPS
jgi:nucleotide-binding universal stress UspA family protein